MEQSDCSFEDIFSLSALCLVIRMQASERLGLINCNYTKYNKKINIAWFDLFLNDQVHFLNISSKLSQRPSKPSPKENHMLQTETCGSNHQDSVLWIRVSFGRFPSKNRKTDCPEKI